MKRILHMALNNNNVINIFYNTNKYLYKFQKCRSFAYEMLCEVGPIQYTVNLILKCLTSTHNSTGEHTDNLFTINYTLLKNSNNLYNNSRNKPNQRKITQNLQ